MTKKAKDLEPFVKVLFYYKQGHLRRRLCTNSKQKVGQLVGYIDKNGYVRVEIDGVSYGEHRLIWLFHYGYLPKEVDHKNGCRADNHIANLRECTHAQNMYNAGHLNKSTGVRGVTLTPNGRYRVRITVNKCINLGTFSSLELAEFIASEARIKYHKEFAYDRQK